MLIYGHKNSLSSFSPISFYSLSPFTITLDPNIHQLMFTKITTNITLKISSGHVLQIVMCPRNRICSLTSNHTLHRIISTSKTLVQVTIKKSCVTHIWGQRIKVKMICKRPNSYRWQHRTEAEPECHPPSRCVEKQHRLLLNKEGAIAQGPI